MNRMARITALTVSAVLLALASAGCTHGPHEDFTGGGSGSGADTDASGHIAAELVWDEQDGEQEAIGDILLLTTAADGTENVRSFESPQEAASQSEQLPAGSCRLFAAVNMTAGNGYLISTLGTRAGELAGGVRVSPAGEGVQPSAQAWFGIGEATVEAGRLNIVRCELQRTVPSLSIRVTGVPEGTSVSVSVQRVADHIDLDTDDGNGGLGLPSLTYSSVSLGDLPAEGDGSAALGVTGRYIFPTASGYQRTYLDIYLTDSAGSVQHAVADTPAMAMGYSYTAEFDYTVITPYMYLDSCTISDWEEGWTVSGSAPDPDGGRDEGN